MHPDFSTDILQPASDKQMLQYFEIIKELLPRTIRAHHFLLTHRKWQKILQQSNKENLVEQMSTRCKNNLYTHFSGNVKNCTFVAITDECNNDKHENCDDYMVFVFSLEENHQELRQCLEYTKRIHWELGPLFSSIEKQHLPILTDIMHKRSYTIQWEVFDNIFYLPKGIGKSIEYDIPDGLIISQLKPDDADIINSKWPYRCPGTDDYFRSQIILNGGLGLYEQGSNRLISWVLRNDNNAAGSLQTIDSEMRKGYGLLIIKAFCKQFAEEENMDVLVFIIVTNIPSFRLFKQIGFKECGGCSWQKLNPSKKHK